MNPSEQIDKQIKDAGGWKAEIMTQLRALIHTAAPEIVEEWKWGTGIYTHKGMVCAVSAFKDHVKINFFKGAELEDKDKLFNNGFDAKQHRSIDFKEGDKIKDEPLKSLIQAAVTLNTGKSRLY
jgi:hypothetical protein